MSAAGFGDLPEAYRNPDTARIAVIPAPYDGTSTWLKGADRGPEAIIEASAHLELYDIETDSEVYRRGILTEEPVAAPASFSPEAVIREVQERVELELAAGRFPVLLGGEHSVSLGAIRAISRRYRDLSVLQLDAHADLRQEFEGSPYNHACVMARVRELAPIVQVGIRSMDASEKAALEPGRVFFAESLARRPDWIGEALALLSPRVYLTFDLDVLDPGIMPSTGTPEPGGLGWYQTLELLKRLCAERELVGFDLVELCPGASRAPDFLAAKLVYKLLSYRFEGARR
jgi:agmatinase